MNETTLISKCCRREVVQYDDGQTGGIYGDIKTMCTRCGKYCEAEEVCIDCLGTKEVSTDVDDGEGHTMRGVGTEKCRRCTLSTKDYD